MNAHASLPTRRLRGFAAFARWALRLLLAFWLLVAGSMAALHWWAMPRLAQWQPQLEAHAGRWLGGQVLIGSIQALPNGLIPAVQVRDFQLRNGAGEVVLEVPQAVAAVSPRSLWRKGFEQLVFRNAVIRVRRDGGGQWHVAGQALQRDGAAGGQPGAGGGQALDWLLSQPELLVQDAQLWLTDAQGSAPELKLRDVQVLLRHQLRGNELLLRAQPDVPGSSALELRAQVRRPLVAAGGASWAHWSGQTWLEWPQADLAAFAPYASYWPREWPLPQNLQGHAGLRAWLDWRFGQPGQGTVDVVLRQVSADIPGAGRPLDIAHFATRLTGRRTGNGWELATEGLNFQTGAGLRWPQGDIAVAYQESPVTRTPGIRISASHADVGALAQLLQSAPWNASGETSALQRQLARWQPAGAVDGLKLEWQGGWAQWPPAQGYSAQASFRQLRLGMAAAVDDEPLPLGLRGVSGEIELTEQGGAARLQFDQGELRLPGVLAEAIAIDSLDTHINWRAQADGQIRLEVADAAFANPHAQGHARAVWRTYTDAEMRRHARQGSTADSRYPGVLELSGRLTRADGAQVWRYLPLSIEDDVRRYIREAILQGSASEADFVVRGDLRRFPFDGAEKVRQARLAGASELFRIAARLEGVDYRYAPHYLFAEGQPVWPDLADVSGNLVFEGNTMQLQVSQGRLRQDASVRIQQGSARIANLLKAEVEVDVQASGPLQNQLDVIAGTPVAKYTDHTLDGLSGTGSAALRLQLGIPLSKSPHYSVAGQLDFQDNELRWWPQMPVLSAVNGRLTFNEKGFEFKDLQAQALGGSAQLSARMLPFVQGQPVQTEVQASGTLTAQGLQAYAPQGAARQLAQHLQGGTDYTLGVRTVGGRVFVDIRSQLVGLASHLPAPLAKPADGSLALRIRTQAAEAGGAQGGTALHVSLGEVVQADYAQAASGQVTGGQVFVGGFSADEKRQPDFIASVFAAVDGPPPGVRAYVRLDELDASAWQTLLGDAQAAADAGRKPAVTPPGENPLAYFPPLSHWQIGRLRWHDRALHDAHIQLAQPGAGQGWNAQVKAREMVGQLEYRLPAAGKTDDAGLLKARLSYLELPEDPAAAQAEAARTAAGQPASADTQPERLPALDLQIERLLFASRDWGRVQLQAVNMPDATATAGAGTEWRVSHLAIQTPEAEFTAKGNWKLLQSLHHSPLLLGIGKRTALQFRLDVRDAARLLARLGMPGVLQGGQGRLEGHLGWLGAPTRPDYPSLTGKFSLRIDDGQFLRADAGMARLLGVLNLQALPRRLSLDFRDVFSDGFAFDFVQGDFTAEQGVISSNNLQMKGVNAAVVMDGQADIANETQNLRVVVVPEINALTASLVATAINPAIGAGSFLAQLFLSRPLAAAATREFHVHGSWQEPQVERLKAHETTAP